MPKHWAKYLLQCMGFVKRRASTAAKVSVSNFEQWQAQYSFDVKLIIEMEDMKEMEENLHG